MAQDAVNPISLQNGDTLRQHLDVLWNHLETERSNFDSHWQELDDHITARRVRFQTTDKNKGRKKRLRIMDSTATLAARTLRSGMMSGITSPARPWFRLGTTNPALRDLQSVRMWLDEVTRRMQQVFLQSNLYQELPNVYGDLGVFATAAMSVEEDFEKVVRFHTYLNGSFAISNDDKLRVRVFMREFRFTVRQIVEKFGERDPNNPERILNWNDFSNYVKESWQNGQKEHEVDVRHAIYPNPFWDPNRMEARFKRYASTYYEVGGEQKYGDSPSITDNTQNKYLRLSGFDMFPVLCPRWEIAGEDVYGTSSPGMIALGDIRQLQIAEKRILQGIEKMVMPPMVADSMLKNMKTSILPGDTTWTSERDGQKAFRPAHEVNPRVVELDQKQDSVRQRIQRSFYEDLMLMLALSDRREITATEVVEKKEEKLLALGPVLERLNWDLLDPLIDITFDIMLRQGLIPEPPPELAGTPLKVEYISIMAQAQKLVNLGTIERFLRFVGEVVGVTQDINVLDKVDIDQLIDEFSEITGTPPSIVRSDEVVAQIRRQRIAEAEAAARQQRVVEGARAAKDLAAADTGGDNALTRMIDRAGAGELVEATP